MAKSIPWIPLLALIGAALAGMGAHRLQEPLRPATEVAGLNAHETHAGATLLGQFRTNISAWLWLRTDRYLHNGVEMRPLTDQELAAGQMGVGTSDNHEKDLHDDSAMRTVVPSQSEDFRGWMGDVERATSTYKDMTNHGHNSPKTALPLFRLMTWLDPHFIRGWTTGSAAIGWGRVPGSEVKMMAYLKEGLEKNPQSVAIHMELGSVKVRRQRDFRGAIPDFAAAIRYGGPNLEKLGPDDQEALQDAFRWKTLCHREIGDYEGKVASAKAGLQLFPEDSLLMRLLHESPLKTVPGQKTPDRVEIPEEEEEHH